MFAPLEKFVGYILKLLDIVQKFWAPLRKLVAAPGVPSWLRACILFRTMVIRSCKSWKELFVHLHHPRNCVILVIALSLSHESDFITFSSSYQQQNLFRRETLISNYYSRFHFEELRYSQEFSNG